MIRENFQVADPSIGRIVMEQAGRDVPNSRFAKQVIGHARDRVLSHVFVVGLGCSNRAVKKIYFVSGQAELHQSVDEHHTILAKAENF